MGHRIAIGRLANEPPLTVAEINAALEADGLEVLEDHPDASPDTPFYWGYVSGGAVADPPENGAWQAPWVDVRIPNGALLGPDGGIGAYRRLLGLADRLGARLFDDGVEMTLGDLDRARQNLADSAALFTALFGEPGEPSETVAEDPDALTKEELAQLLEIAQQELGVPAPQTEEEVVQLLNLLAERCRSGGS